MHVHFPELEISNRRYILGTAAAIFLGSVVLGGTALASSAISGSASRKANTKADEATAKAKETAAQKSLAETQGEEKTAKARKLLLDTPTSGFGPNPNLARSFLTTL